MREYLFRAKAINRVEGREYRTTYKNGDWVYGLISRPYKDMFPTLPMEFRNENGVEGIEVDYKTVGQFTGLTDKNGKKIFEGDIVKDNFGDLLEVCYIDEWKNYGFKGIELIKKRKHVYLAEFKDYPENEIEVIGNIHDNPELLDKAE